MRSLVRAVCLLAVVCSGALVGCVKLARETPPLQRYALGGVPAVSQASEARGAPSDSRRTFSVGLSRLDLSSHLSVPSVLLRRGANELVTSEFHRWGGDLDQGINRAVATYLGAAPAVRNVDVAPWTARARHDVIVQLHVIRFEGIVADSLSRAGAVQVLAGWDIIRPLDGAVLVRGSTDDRGGTFHVGDYAGLVRALDAALAHVARDIGACLARFPNDSTPPANCTPGATGTGSDASRPPAGFENAAHRQ